MVAKAIIGMVSVDKVYKNIVRENWWGREGVLLQALIIGKVVSFVGERQNEIDPFYRPTYTC